MSYSYGQNFSNYLHYVNSTEILFLPWKCLLVVRLMLSFAGNIYCQTAHVLENYMLCVFLTGFKMPNIAQFHFGQIFSNCFFGEFWISFMHSIIWSSTIVICQNLRWPMVIISRLKLFLLLYMYVSDSLFYHLFVFIFTLQIGL
jgi:hypothetical protein